MRVSKDNLTNRVLNTGGTIGKLDNQNTLGGSKGGREDSKGIFSAQAQSNSQGYGVLNNDVNDTDSVNSDGDNELNSGGNGFDKEWNNDYELDDLDAESNKTDIVEDGTMNVFGFNDDMNLDDRLIVQNATDNQIYNLVERPKYLLSFELKDSEQEFLYTISKQEAKKTTIYLS